MEGWNYSTQYAPTLQRYHNSTAKIRGIGGPPGSGKSVACAVEHTMFLACRQEPDSQNRRRTKVLILRSTYPKLKRTTHKTVTEWIPEGTGKIPNTPPMEGSIAFKHPSGDGTRVMVDIVFMSIETEKDLENLDSMEPSSIYINEANEMIATLLPKCIERIGRYPPPKDGVKCTEPCVSLDFNLQAEEHWLYKVLVKKDIEENEFFKKTDIEYFQQPPAVFCTNYQVVLECNAKPEFVFNPGAENLPNLPEGYYGGQLAVNNWSKTQARLMMMWVAQNTGKAIHEEYKPEYHEAREPIPIIQGLTVYVGFDTSGHNKGCTYHQYANGQLRVLRETYTKGGTEKAIDNDIIPTLQQTFRGCPVVVVCDPANPSDERTYVTPTQLVKEKLDEAEIYDAVVVAAPGNNRLQLRINAVDKFHKRIGGFLVDPSCTMTRQGFGGEYVFEKDAAASNAAGEDRYKFKKLDNKWAHYIDSVQNVCLYLTSAAGKRQVQASAPSGVTLGRRRVV